jgi:hypothetical protein
MAALAVKELDALTASLAEHVMGWGVGPDRFLLGQRSWIPRWRFQPFRRVEDAFRLVEKARPQQFAMETDAQGITHVRVRVKLAAGEAHDRSIAAAIALAVARAIELAPAGKDGEPKQSVVKAGRRLHL